MKRIFLNHPSLSNLEKKHVLDVIKNKWLSSKGKHTKIFEKKLAKFIGLKYCLAVQSGTAALHVALKGAGVKQNDKVIIPNFTCNSNISSVSQCNAKPIIVEIEMDTLGLDYQLTKKAIDKYRPKVLQLVHVYGFPAKDTKKIVAYCKKKKVIVIEDASEALGARIGKKLVGTFGDIGIFSTRSEKMIGVGEGGVILSNNKKIFEKINLLASRNSPFRNKKDPYWEKYYTNGEGYNYLMPHLLGAVGRAQIERFKKNILPKKIKVGKNYRKLFKDNRIIFSQKILKGFFPVFWLNSLIFPYMNKTKVHQLGNYLIKFGIEIRPGFWPMSKLKNYKSTYIYNKKNSEFMLNHSIIIPSSYDLTEKQIKIILKLIINFLEK